MASGSDRSARERGASRPMARRPDEPVSGAPAPRPRSGAYPPEVRARAEALYRAGVALAEITTQTGAPPSRVTRWMAEIGVSRRAQARYSPEVRARAEALYRAGVPFGEIAAQTGAPPGTIAGWMSQRGVPRRRP